MCFFSSSAGPAPAPVSAAPVRSLSSSFARSANATALTAGGTRDTIATSGLGDSSFGSNIRKPTFLGQTGSAYA